MTLFTVLSSLSMMTFVLAHSGDTAMSRPLNVMDGILLPRAGHNVDGRICDFTDGNYVSWSETSDAIRAWCSSHAGTTVGKNSDKSDTVLKVGGDYLSGNHKVKLYVKYRNDHVKCCVIDEEECNWYLSYIAQGCTKGGNLPSKPSNQATDGGTYYLPNIGSVDMQWQRI